MKRQRDERLASTGVIRNLNVNFEDNKLCASNTMSYRVFPAYIPIIPADHSGNATRRSSIPRFRTASHSIPPAASSQPWEIGGYFTKKKRRRTDELGNLIDAPEDTAESFAWSSVNARRRLAAVSLSKQLQRSPEELLENVEILGTIIPGGQDTLDKLRPADVVRLAADVDKVPGRLIDLRERLPQGTDVRKAVVTWPEVMLLSREEVGEGLAGVREAFEEEVGDEGISAIVETTPGLLKPELLHLTLHGAGHLMPRRQLADALARDPGFYLEFMSLTLEPENNYEDVMEEDLEAWRSSRSIEP